MKKSISIFLKEEEEGLGGQANYRIYSRISREILDKILPKFYQFNLYVGQSIFIILKMISFFMYVCFRLKETYIKCFTKIQFWTFFNNIFSI
jgi:hypothetical protein